MKFSLFSKISVLTYVIVTIVGASLILILKHKVKILILSETKQVHHKGFEEMKVL